MFLDQINKKLAALQSEQGTVIPLKKPAARRNSDMPHAAMVKSKVVGSKVTRPLGASSLSSMAVKKTEEKLIEVDAYVIPAIDPIEEEDDFGDLAELAALIEAEATPVEVVEDPKPVELVPEVTKPEPALEPEPEPEPEPAKPKPVDTKPKVAPPKPGTFKTVGVALPLPLHAEMTAFLHDNKASGLVPSSLKMFALACIRRGFEEIKNSR